MTRASTPEPLVALAVYKLTMGLLLCAVAFELVHLLEEDLADAVHRWVLRLHADPHNPLVVAIMGRAGGIEPSSLEEYAVISGLFGNIHLIEGIGLWLRRRWAEYLCVAGTAALIPLEVYELVAQPHVTQMMMLAVNVAVVGYLAHRLRRYRGVEHGRVSP
jgi:uncharacterized membrane protein (DUF2068 family)